MFYHHSDWEQYTDIEGDGDEHPPASAPSMPPFVCRCSFRDGFIHAHIELGEHDPINLLHSHVYEQATGRSVFPLHQVRVIWDPQFAKRNMPDYIVHQFQWLNRLLNGPEIKGDDNSTVYTTGILLFLEEDGTTADLGHDLKALYRMAMREVISGDILRLLAPLRDMKNELEVDARKLYFEEYYMREVYRAPTKDLVAEMRARFGGEDGLKKMVMFYEDKTWDIPSSEIYGHKNYMHKLYYTIFFDNPSYSWAEKAVCLSRVWRKNDHRAHDRHEVSMMDTIGDMVHDIHDADRERMYVACCSAAVIIFTVAAIVVLGALALPVAFL